MRIYITARYAHLARESVKTSAAKAAESIGSDMVGSRLRSGRFPVSYPAARLRRVRLATAWMNVNVTAVTGS